LICTTNCVHRVDSRINEIECADHGTVIFTRRPHDRVEHEYGYNPYSDAYIIKCAEYYQGQDLGDLASLLGVPRASVYKQLKRAKKTARENL